MVVMAATTATTHAIIISQSQNFIAGGDGVTNDWAGVGQVGQRLFDNNGNPFNAFGCTGTVIGKDDLGSQFILTAAHCVSSRVNGALQVIPNDAGRFRLDSAGQIYNSTNVYVHPNYNGLTRDGSDIAVIRLQNVVQDANNNVIVPWRINKGSVDESSPGLTAHKVGFGVGGNAYMGQLRAPGAGPNIAAGFAFGTKREGKNSVSLVVDAATFPNGIAPGALYDAYGHTEQIPKNTLVFDFDNHANLGFYDVLHDNGANPTYGAEEANTTQGDSGGPMFQFDFNLGRFVVVGVTSYGFDHPSFNGGIFAGSPPPFGGFFGSRVGDISVDTQVLPYSGWVNSIIPEPGTAALLLPGLLGLYCRRTRLRRDA